MLTNNEIKKQIDQGNIVINNMQANALDKPNSCNVHIGDTLYIYDYGIVDTKEKHSYINEVKSDNINKLRRINIPKEGLVLEPYKVYLAKTIESIKTNGYVPVLNGKVSYSLLGMSVELTSGYFEDNYDGEIIINIVATKPTRIYPGINIGNLTFFKSLSENDKTTGMLSGEEIKNRMGNDIIITPQDNIVINPNSVNLTLADTIGYYKDVVLDTKENNEIEFVTIPEDGLILYPDQIYVGRTNEWTETNNLIPMISGRSSLGRLGYHAHCSASMGSIGYKGYWHLGIRTTLPLKVYKDMKCCQIYYFTSDGEITNTYEGSMQNLSKDEMSSQLYRKLKK